LKVIIAGGGTGGHLYIGVALARELLRRDKATEVLFVGTRTGLESRIVLREGFRLEYIVSAGLKRMGIRTQLRNVLLIPKSLLQSRQLVKSYRPNVVVGVGGYSSGPVVLAASRLGCPTLIIEPNAYPGITNRWLAPFIDRAALALPEAGRYFGRKAVLTGIPVRDDFHRIPPRTKREPFTVLIYGGSQGSHALNSIVCGSLAELTAAGSRLRLIHQTGEKEFETVQAAYRDAGVDADVRPFLPAIYEEFAAADLLLSRAGAGTVAEVTAAGKAAILVPFPGAADDHQTKNALALEKCGAAKMIAQKDWEPGRLLREIRFFMDNHGELERMERAARAQAKPEAAARIADMVLALATAL
jgi:UDP-N-acetylglucosamine--N-acetylmuramyl-(pentapeptide) pyrophosphoryl-undecaprenol N-acetylglucosamine transferase